jgi:hypothetical protein
MRRSVIAVAAFLASTSLALACGTERWAVKTGTDRDAAQVSMTAQPTTVSALVSQPAPARPNAQTDTRYAPTELTVFAVSAILKVIKREKDQDYHLVIADPQTGETMIVEASDPDCTDGSRFAAEITGARQQIEAQFQGQIRERHEVNIPVDVTGIAFFDPIHGQEGVAANGIELHPILSIAFH